MEDIRNVLSFIFDRDRDRQMQSNKSREILNFLSVSFSQADEFPFYADMHEGLTQFRLCVAFVFVFLFVLVFFIYSFNFTYLYLFVSLQPEEFASYANAQ